MRTPVSSARRESRQHFAARTTVSTVAAISALLLAACQANPGDPPTVAKPESSATESTPPTAPPSEESLQVTVGVDAFGGNLNPHLVGNNNPVQSAIADLTLPSTHIRHDGVWRPDPNLVTAVKPNDPLAPTQVVYTLNPAAQWSDGTPITISDFRYLHTQIVEGKATEEAALYEKIESIEPGDNASILVKFRSPLTQWQALFRHLLPSHIYHAESQPFASMMEGSLAASAGAFAVTSFDAGRGRVELRRNDRFWGVTPAATDRIIFEVVPNLTTGMQMIRSGQMQLMSTNPQDVTALALGSLPHTQQRTVQRQVDLTLTLNTLSPRLSTTEQRKRLLSSIDPTAVAQIATGRVGARPPAEPPLLATAAGATADERGSSPAAAAPRRDGQPVPAETGGAGATSAATASDVTEATDASDTTGAPERRGGSSEQLVIAAPTEDVRAVAASRVLADQLTSAGIPARAISPESAELFSTDVPSGTVDAVVSWQPALLQPSALYDQFHCEPLPEGQAPRPSPNAQSSSTTENRPRVTSGNISGLCDRELVADLGDVIEGRTPFSDAQRRINERIAAANVVVPLVRDEQAVVAGASLVGPNAPIERWGTDPYTGIMATATQWKKQDTRGTETSLEGKR